MKDLTRQELLTILHVRTAALEEVRRLVNEPDLSNRESIRAMNTAAGHALCMGPNTATLCAMANEEMEKRKVPEMNAPARKLMEDLLMRWNGLPASIVAINAEHHLEAVLRDIEVKP